MAAGTQGGVVTTTLSVGTFSTDFSTTASEESVTGGSGSGGGSFSWTDILFILLMLAFVQSTKLVARRKQ